LGVPEAHHVEAPQIEQAAPFAPLKPALHTQDVEAPDPWGLLALPGQARHPADVFRSTAAL
jgi:hypothetical protein